MTEEERFLKLLKYYNELKRNNRYLEIEDPEAFKPLLNFLVKIEGNLHYSEKEVYLGIMKDFLEDEITAEDFCYAFFYAHGEIGKKINKMKEEESLELLTFLKMPDYDWLSTLLAIIYGSCDAFSLDPELNTSSEEELKIHARTLESILEYELLKEKKFKLLKENELLEDE